MQDGTGKVTIRIGGRIVYVYYPAPAQPLISSNTDVTDDCVNYQVNCTDEQNCRCWGAGCNRITGTDTQAVEKDSSVSDSSAGAPANDTATDEDS